MKLAKCNFVYSISTLAAIALLAGCAGGSAMSDRAAEPAISQQAAVNDAQKSAKVHTELGSLYFQRANYAVALDEAKVALESDPNYAPAHNLMGLTYMQLRENGPAEKSFEQALSLAASDPEINNSFGWFLCQTGQEQRSLKYFHTAIKSPLYATPAMPYANAGVCALRMKDDAAAEEYFNKALRLDGQNRRAIFFLADIAYRQGRLGVARLHLVELHKLIESSPESLWLALRTERKLGDRAAETRYATQLQRQYPAAAETQKLIQGQYE